MKSNNLTLGEILAAPCQYVIPVFQRDYRWDQPQWDRLWTDLFELQRPEKTGRHFMGFLVMVPETFMPGRINRAHLIDGQQRPTTLSLALCVLRDAARAGGFDELAMEIEVSTLVHQFNRGDERYRLFPKMRDREPYVACLDGEPPTEGRLGSAVRYFVGRLATIPGGRTEAGLRGFYDLLRQRLEFVHAQLEGENAFNIFKSLNSTGIPLGPADLIRNFVFMSVPVEEQEDFDRSLWRPLEHTFEDDQGNLDADGLSALLRDHLMRDGNYIPPRETFEAFQRHHSATAFDPRRVVAELKQAAQWYRILRGGHQPDPDPEVEESLAPLRQLESSTTYSLLLNLYQRRHRGQLVPADLAECLRLLSGFILRRLVCGENSRGYAMLFAAAAAALGDDPPANLRRYLEARGFPDTPRFIEDFVRFNLYASRYRKPILEALERANGHKEPADLATAQVEHIMPQTLTETWREELGLDFARIHATWLHTPGNLTLTGYNPELLNKPFAAKRDAYRKSNIVMTRRVADAAAWGEAEILARGRALGQQAAGLWAGPAVPPIPERRPVLVGSPLRDVRRRFWSEFRTFMRSRTTPLQISESDRGSYSLLCGSWPGGFQLWSYANFRHKRLAVSLFLRRADAPDQFRRLREHKDSIEAEIGAPCIWDAASHRRWFEILLRNPVDPEDEARWPSYFEWLGRTLEAFHRTLDPLIREPAGGSHESAGAGDLPENLQFNVDYWTAFRDRLLRGGSILRPRKPRPEYWTTLALGCSGAYVSAFQSRRSRWIGVDLILHGPRRKAVFRYLLDDRPAIEAEVGEPLEWFEHAGEKHSKIRLRRMGVPPDDRDDWPRQHEWLRRQLEAFHRIFVPRIGRPGDRDDA